MQVTDEMVEAAWAAYQNTPIDLLADSDDETKRCVVNALTAALAAMWRPIGDGDDASRSGQRALVTGGGLDGEVEVAKYNSRIGCWEAETCTLDDRDDEVDGYSKPTHFMPLPSPPKAEG